MHPTEKFGNSFTRSQPWGVEQRHCSMRWNFECESVWKEKAVPAGFLGFACKIDVGVEVFKTVNAVGVAHVAVLALAGETVLAFFDVSGPAFAGGRSGHFPKILIETSGIVESNWVSHVQNLLRFHCF